MIKTKVGVRDLTSLSATAFMLSKKLSESYMLPQDGVQTHNLRGESQMAKLDNHQATGTLIKYGKLYIFNKSIPYPEICNIIK